MNIFFNTNQFIRCDKSFFVGLEDMQVDLLLRHCAKGFKIIIVTIDDKHKTNDASSSYDDSNYIIVQPHALLIDEILNQLRFNVR